MVILMHYHTIQCPCEKTTRVLIVFYPLFSALMLLFVFVLSCMWCTSTFFLAVQTEQHPMSSRTECQPLNKVVGYSTFTNGYNKDLNMNLSFIQIDRLRLLLRHQMKSMHKLPTQPLMGFMWMRGFHPLHALTLVTWKLEKYTSQNRKNGYSYLSTLSPVRFLRAPV
jgi:hypothetical protein